MTGELGYWIGFSIGSIAGIFVLPTVLFVVMYKGLRWHRKVSGVFAFVLGAVASATLAAYGNANGGPLDWQTGIVMYAAPAIACALALWFFGSPTGPLSTPESTAQTKLEPIDLSNAFPTPEIATAEDARTAILQRLRSLEWKLINRSDYLTDDEAKIIVDRILTEAVGGMIGAISEARQAYENLAKGQWIPRPGSVLGDKSLAPLMDSDDLHDEVYNAWGSACETMNSLQLVLPPKQR